QNPALYGLITLVFLLIIIVLIKSKFFIPLELKNRQLEIEKTELMALFAATDPDPIIRVGNNNEILAANETAIREFGNKVKTNSEINDLIPKFRKIFVDQTDYKEILIGNNFFLVSVREIKKFEFTHVYFTNISKRKQYETEIKNNKESLRKLRMKIVHQKEEESKRIGKELHDIIGNNLTFLKKEFLAFSPLFKDDSKFSNVITHIENIQKDVKEISYKLKPRLLHEFGLESALNSLIASNNTSNKIQGSIYFEAECSKKINKEMEANIFRICIEAISNILRHSNANLYELQIFSVDNGFKLIISDDGNGFDVEKYFSSKNSSLGLLDIRENVESYNGTIIINSSNNGTLIIITFNKDI
ncbi:MAG: hypothetical protein KDC52_10925, partial [Ignavibacteriae bacterium]|nr:hypothetical protein [Ignavibacteriota bacterium]